MCSFSAGVEDRVWNADTGRAVTAPGKQAVANLNDVYILTRAFFWQATGHVGQGAERRRCTHPGRCDANRRSKR